MTAVSHKNKLACGARQLSDAMNCGVCGLSWDMNDPAPPECGPRILRDRLGEAMRRGRHGMMRPLWPELNEPIREQYRSSADALLVAAKNCGLKIEEAKA